MSETERPHHAPVIEARGLSKTFRDFWGRPKIRAVNGVDFSVSAGEVFGLLGPNGSGKSTTIKMILGLLRPTSGAVRVFGRDPGDVSTRSKLGYMPEESALYRHLTPREILSSFAQLAGVPPAERAEHVNTLLRLVNLQDAADRLVGEFSKGMARRVVLAQALLADPDLLLLDEPTSGLDPLGCRQVKNLIRDLANRGKTVLLCSHRLADMQDVCGRVMILAGGEVCIEGAVADLLCRPERCRITVPRLSDEALRQLVEAVRRIAAAEPEVDRPMRTLEDLFLEVIERRLVAGDANSPPKGSQVP